MANKSYRLMFRFWLDIEKSDEESIANKIEILKNSRSYSKTIRDGIRLIWDLRQGKTDILREFFPGVVASLQQDSEVVQQFQAMLKSQQQQIRVVA